MPKPKLELKEILFPTLSLFLICFVMTGALAVVNAITKDPIAANEKLAADAARQEIFPGATFENHGDYFTAKDVDGDVLGYCMDTQAQGYGGVIRVAAGLDAGGGVVKVRIISCDGETPGLGQKIREEGFLAQFAGRGDTEHYDSVASATYSSRGVADAVNQAFAIYQEQIRGGGAQ